MTELAHVGRQATAGELSSSIAHELNQPLGAILTNAETAELILQSPSPDLAELKEILADIRRDDQRASEVIHRMRSFLKRTPFELRDVDLNDVMREAFGFLAVQASTERRALFPGSPEALRIKGDAVQLQQVILNLVVNSMEAMSAMPYGRAVIGRTELNGGSSAIISISDLGPGIPPEKLTTSLILSSRQKQGYGDRAFHRPHHCSGSQGKDLGREPAGRRRGIPAFDAVGAFVGRKLGGYRSCR